LLKLRISGGIKIKAAGAEARLPAKFCLSGDCSIVACVALGFLGLSLPCAAQISPGPLSRAHQSLSGLTNCTTCHELSKGKPTFRCIECHREIGSRIAAHKGLHASFDIEPGSSQKCRRCHSEHNGEDFVLIKWDIKTFDHKKTGYPLLGKHAGLACNKCHSAAHVSASERATIRVKDLNRTFLGVSPACVTCHQDPHKNRLGPDCLQCHNFSDWKAVKVGKFDHSKTRYPLTGLHARVPCQQCHTAGRDGKPRYTGIPFAHCEDCHTDPHRGGFQQTCEACHSTASWKQFSATELDKTFDHSKTKYPLLGKHATVACDDCHAGGDFKKPLAFQKCMDCHTPDPHGGQFSHRQDKGECASCHTVNGFKPSTFGVKEHAKTAYPLEGKHASLKCGQCHVPKGKDTLYKLKFKNCTDCHKDPHGGQFTAAPYLNRCEECHNLERFQPSTFSLARHQKTTFPLSGGHEAVACNDCHRLSAEFKPPSARYYWLDTACTTCHKDAHRGQFDELMRRAGAGGKFHGCEVCHSAESWQELSHFDHSKTSFPLLGAHLTTPCRACHKPSSPQIAPALADFKVAPKQCEACHEDIHGAQFAKSGVTACADCHDSAKWKPSLFDHDTRTSFPLQGAHRKTPCAGCHKLMRVVTGKTVLFYKPTPKECVACHKPAASS
jgi:Cytochrome c7 and related cytochrome c